MKPPVVTDSVKKLDSVTQMQFSSTNVVNDDHRPPSGLQRPRPVPFDRTQLHRAYPNLAGVPTSYIKHRLRELSRIFLTSLQDISTNQPASSSELPDMPVGQMFPTHIFSIPVTPGLDSPSDSVEDYLHFPIHDIVFMVMCHNLKVLPPSPAPSESLELLPDNAVELPVVTYEVPAPYAFSVFQEHLYRMDYEYLTARLMNMQQYEFDRARDTFLEQMSEESIRLQAQLVLGFWQNAMHFAFHDERTFVVIDTCWTYLCRARRLQANVISQSA